MSFEEKIRAALAAIPHVAYCAALSLDEMPPLGPCDCDRNERIAKRVAGAVEQFGPFAERAFLEVLGRESREEPTA